MRWIAGFFLSLTLSAAPQFTNVTVRGMNVILGASGGASNGSYTLLVSSNTLSWNPVTTNEFDGKGRLTLTNPVNSTIHQQYYSLQTPSPPNASWTPGCGAWLGAVCTNNGSLMQWVSGLEAQIGRQVDVIREYHTPGSWSNLSSTELTCIHTGRKLLESVKPSNDWTNAIGAANGGSATVDAQMTSLAKSIAGVKPAQIMLIVFHEPENNVTGGGGPGANSGSPATYVAMWHNVRKIFDANGATNVIWCWDVQNIAQYRSLLPSLWPGNNYVDWVMWDQYQGSSTDNLTNDTQVAYQWFASNSNATNNYLSKYIGIAEWGVGINSYVPTLAEQTNGIANMNKAINVNNQFPWLKLLSYYDDLASALQLGAVPVYSNLANSSYLKQQCPP